MIHLMLVINYYFLGKKMIQDNMVFIVNSSDALVHTVMANNIDNPLEPTVMTVENYKID